jgi:hypothetical protein
MPTGHLQAPPSADPEDRKVQQLQGLAEEPPLPGGGKNSAGGRPPPPHATLNPYAFAEGIPLRIWETAPGKTTWESRLTGLQSAEFPDAELAAPAARDSGVSGRTPACGPRARLPTGEISWNNGVATSLRDEIGLRAPETGIRETK